MAEKSALEKLADGSGVKEIWERVFTGVKSITGAVDVAKDGTLQAQINELKTSSGITVDAEMSATSTNPVQNKTIYTEIDNLKKSVSDGKRLVAEAITQKGIETATDATFATMANNISEIKTESGFKIGDVTNVIVEFRCKSVALKWTDPDNDSTIEGIEVAWAGTKVVRKEGSIPNDVNDGTLVIDSKIRNQYSETEFIDRGLTPDITYYYRFFPYTTNGIVTNSSSVSGIPRDLKIVTFADGAWVEISDMLEAHYLGEIDISDYWSVGDARTMSDGSVHKIIGMKHDDLETTINGVTKAAVTILKTTGLIGYKMNSSRDSYTDADYSTSLGRTTVRALKDGFEIENQSLIKNVKKTSAYPTNSSNTQALKSSVEDLFLLSNWEMFGVPHDYVTVQDGTQYEWCKNSSNRSSIATWWWSRSGFWPAYDTEPCAYFACCYYGSYRSPDIRYYYTFAPAYCW